MINTPKGYERFSTLSEPQNQLLGNLMSLLQGQLGEQGAGKFGEPYKREFHEEIIPGLAETFSNLGAGAQNSSAFQQALGKSAVNLEEKLANIGAQKEQNTLGLLLQLLGIPTEGLIKKAPSSTQNLLGSLAGGLGKIAGNFLPSGLGFLAKGIGSLFSGKGTEEGNEL
jgi:hypothetical protein